VSKRSSRARLLAVTAQLLREQGYAATTLKQILEQGQASRSSLYYLFPLGKSELAAAALREQHKQLMQGLHRLQLRHPYAGEGIPALFQLFAREMEETGFTKGSALAAMTMGGVDEVVRLEVSRCYRALRGFFHSWLVRSGVPASVAAPRAELALILLEGALVLCRAHRSSEPLKQALRQLGPIVLVSSSSEGV